MLFIMFKYVHCSEILLPAYICTYMCTDIQIVVREGKNHSQYECEAKSNKGALAVWPHWQLMCLSMKWQANQKN